MATRLIDLGHALTASVDDMPGLEACLTQLVGEPFRFARVSYGDELTLHFGDLRPQRSPKLQQQYGTYVLGVQGLGLAAEIWLRAHDAHCGRSGARCDWSRQAP